MPRKPRRSTLAADLHRIARDGAVLVFDPDTGDLQEAESVCVNGHAVQVNLYEREVQWKPAHLNARVGKYHLSANLTPRGWHSVAYYRRRLGPYRLPSTMIVYDNHMAPPQRHFTARSAMLAAEAAVTADRQKPRNRRKP